MQPVYRYIGPSGLLLFYIITVLLGGFQTVHAQTGGSITVTVTNKTTGEIRAGQNVAVLRHMDESENARVVAEGVTDPTGRYTFRGLPVDNAHYVVATRYLDVQYVTEHLPLAAGSESHEASLDVYEKTTTDEAILLDALHLIVDVQPERLEVTEILVFRNHGNTTFAPQAGGGNGLRLALSPFAFEVQLMSSGIDRTGQGMRYVDPVPPGTAQVVYTYSVERKSINNRLSERLEYDAGRIQILISPSDQAVTGTNVVNDGVRQIGEKNYLLMANTVGLQRGMAVELEFPSTLAIQDIMKWTLLGLVALMVIIGAIVGLRTRPDQASDEEKPAAPSPQGRKDRDREDEEVEDILQAIAELDDQFEAGEVDEKTYHRRRKSLKAKAIRLSTAEE